MATVLETYQAGEGYAGACLQVAQLDPSDSFRYQTPLAEVARAALTERFVRQLGAATLDRVQGGITDSDLFRDLVTMDDGNEPTAYFTTELVRPTQATTVAGFIRVARARPPRRMWVLPRQSDDRRSYPYIRDIDVVPELGRRGIGSLLFDRGLADFPPDRLVELDVHSVNLPALDWYTKLGFAIHKVRSRRVSMGTYAFDKLTMRAPSVQAVRTALQPALVRRGYHPARPDMARVAQNT